MYEADKFLQKTPWAIGRIYLTPMIYGHMCEALHGIKRCNSRLKNVDLQDIIQDEEYRLLFSKLVGLCILTSQVLSGKKYGLNAVYRRLNLEKSRIIRAWKHIKLKTPVRRNGGGVVMHRTFRRRVGV